MAFPSTPYVTSEHTSVGALIGPSPPIEAANFPDEWWDSSDTDDATKGRAFKEDETELALDWLQFDRSTKTGWVRVLWSGTFSGVVPNTVRIYPPLAARASVGASDTYGSFNAFDDDWEMYLPLDEAVNNDADGYKDRTVNANHGTGVSMALPAVAGQVGNAQDFDGSADYIDVSGIASTFSSADVISVFMWANSTYIGTNDPAFTLYKGTAATFLMYPYDTSGGNGLRVFRTPGSRVVDENGATRTGWNHFAYVQDGETDHEGFANGVSVDTTSSSSSFPTDLNNARIGAWRTAQFFPGLIDEVQVHSAARTEDWIREEVAATKNPGTYWGVWTFVPSGATVGFQATLTAVLVNAASAQKRASFTATLAAVFVNTADGRKHAAIVAMAAVLAAAFDNEAAARKETGLDITLEAITLDRMITGQPGRRT